MRPSQSRYRRSNDPKSDKCGHDTDRLPKNKTEVFLTMINKIADVKGTLIKAYSTIGISESVYTKLKNDKYLSVTSAHKILDCYKSIKPFDTKHDTKQ